MLQVTKKRFNSLRYQLYGKKWREKNKTTLNEYNKKWREENKEKRSQYQKEYSKKWREENKEYIKEKWKQNTLLRKIGGIMRNE